MIKFGNYKRIFGLLGKIAIIAIVFGSSFIFGSCEKYLDIEKYVYDQTTLDSIFLSRSRTEEYINGATALLPDESKQTGNDWGKLQLYPVDWVRMRVLFQTCGPAMRYSMMK